MKKLSMTATAAFGLESLVALELKQLGMEVVAVENGRIIFTGDYQDLVRANLWLRTADRVLLQIGEFTATTFDELFEKTRALPWTELLPLKARFPVDGKSLKSKLFSVSDCQAIVKKAVVEKMKEKYRRHWFEESGPLYRIQVSLLNDRATISIDSSGPGLHKRGYRNRVGQAPLKETLAAAMVILSRWKPDRMLVDPFCGSGTIPIEAALIGRNMAPGLLRDFSFLDWPQVPAALWQQVRQEALQAVDHRQPLGIAGYDIDEQALRLARSHAGQAGLHNLITWKRQPVSTLKSPHKYGYVVTNPPFGERLLEKSDLDPLYREMATALQGLDGWSYYILSSHLRLEKFFSRGASKKRKLYNGRIQCNYYQFFGPKPEKLEGPFAKKKGKAHPGKSSP